MRFRTGSTMAAALLAAASALLSASCATSDPSERARTVAERFVAAFGAGDRRTMQDLLAEDLAWTIEGVEDPDGSGAEKLLARLDALRARHGDLYIDGSTLYANGANVIVVGTLRGRRTNSPEILERTFVELRVRSDRLASLHWHEGFASFEILFGFDPQYLDPPDWFLAAMDLAGPARAITLDPYTEPGGTPPSGLDPASGARTAVGGFRITGSAPIEEPEQRGMLSGLLYQGLCLGMHSGNCFEPRHALEIDWHGQKLSVVICFECQAGYVENEAGERRGFSISSRPEPAFSALYRSLGLTVTPKME